MCSLVDECAYPIIVRDAQSRGRICHMLVCTAAPCVARLQQNCTSEHKHTDASSFHPGMRSQACRHSHKLHAYVLICTSTKTVDPLHRRTCESLMHSNSCHTMVSFRQHLKALHALCLFALVHISARIIHASSCERAHVLLEGTAATCPQHRLLFPPHGSHLPHLLTSPPTPPHTQCHVPQRHPRGRALLRHPPLR